MTQVVLYYKFSNSRCKTLWELIIPKLRLVHRENMSWAGLLRHLWPDSARRKAWRSPSLISPSHHRVSTTSWCPLDRSRARLIFSDTCLTRSRYASTSELRRQELQLTASKSHKCRSSTTVPLLSCRRSQSSLDLLTWSVREVKRLSRRIWGW